MPPSSDRTSRRPKERRHCRLETRLRFLESRDPVRDLQPEGRSKEKYQRRRQKKRKTHLMVCGTDDHRVRRLAITKLGGTSRNPMTLPMVDTVIL